MTFTTAAVQTFLRRSLAAGVLALVMGAGLAASVQPAEAFHRHGMFHRRFMHPFIGHRHFHVFRGHRHFHRR